MTYRGTIKGGVVVFAKAPPLKDGTSVRVEPLPQITVKTVRKKQTLHRVGRWQGAPGELKRLLAQVQQDRDLDIGLERND